MSNNRTFTEDLKYQFKFGSATIQLILTNIFVFVGIKIFDVIGRLGNFSNTTSEISNNIFTLDTSLNGLIYKPWGLFTSIFSHYDFMHLLFNMLFLYFAGTLFEQLFDKKRLFYTYLIGGLFGGIFEVLAHLIFPALSGESVIIVGASGSVMAIFSALAFYRPNLQLNLFGLVPVRIIFVAAIFILMDLIALGVDDGKAHFAHMGGVLLGLLSIQNRHENSNVLNIFIRLGDSITHFFQTIFKRKSKLKVSQNNTRSGSFKTDEEYNLDKKQRQQKIDAILDKISKSGYESLSKEEKAFLFQQSNK